jgi:hypothetical protein
MGENCRDGFRDGQLKNPGAGWISVKTREIMGKQKNRWATPENRYTKMEMYQLNKLFIFIPDIQGGALFD